jgi:hypothetical protein
MPRAKAFTTDHQEKNHPADDCRVFAGGADAGDRAAGAIVCWMGQGTGLKGIFIGMTLVGVTPGGPMTHFSFMASFGKMGVGVGPLVAYLTAWSLYGLQRIIMWEIPFLGAKVVAFALP